MKFIKTIPALPIQDIEQALTFYRDRLGFTIGHHDDAFARVTRDEVEIYLWATSDESWRNRSSAMASVPVCSGAETFPAGMASCRFEVRGIDDLYAEYKKSGVFYGPETVIETQPWGSREFPALDHERNLLTFYEPG